MAIHTMTFLTERGAQASARFSITVLPALLICLPRLKFTKQQGVSHRVATCLTSYTLSQGRVVASHSAGRPYCLADERIHHA